MTSEASFTIASFREVQQMRQIWVWVLVLGFALMVVGVFAYGLYQQLVLGRPWGDRPVSDTALLLIAVAMILLMVAMVALIATTRLITEVRPDGLYLRYAPFLRRTISFAEIRSCRARTYRPIAEYLGWGVRWGPSGKAYNVSGNRGVQLELGGGERLLVGSQRADELADALQAHLG